MVEYTDKKHDKHDKPDAMAEESSDLASLYGMTPKVEAAVINAIVDGHAQRVRSLVAPLHPADQADLLERLNKPQRILLYRMLGSTIDPETLAFLSDDMTEEAVGVIGTEGVAKALPELDSDDAVDILEDLQPEERDNILKAMPMAERLFVEEGLSFPEDSAGRMMQREIVVSPSYWTVGQMIDFLRNQKDLPDDFYSIFVVDERRQVLGQVMLARILVSQRPVRLSRLMTNTPHQIPASTDQEEVALLFQRYQLVSAAVVDENNRIVGMIPVDNVVEVIEEEAEEDMMALAQVGKTDIRSTLPLTLRSRLSWLLINLATAIFASIVIGFFDEVIEQLVALAVLMPIVASMGGNAGTQTVTVAVRALATRQLSIKTANNFVVKEAIVGAVNGVVFAITCGLVSWFWFANIEIAIVMGAAMLFNMVMAGLGGALIPIGLKRFGVDPAVASSVFITTVTDVVGFLSFLGLAAAFLV